VLTQQGAVYLIEVAVCECRSASAVTGCVAGACLGPDRRFLQEPLGGFRIPMAWAVSTTFRGVFGQQALQKNGSGLLGSMGRPEHMVAVGSKPDPIHMTATIHDG
jgi:hypothetical protein